MLCSTCDTDNPADAAFCEQCGSKLELLCPVCQTSLSRGARFCKNCGTALEAPATVAAKKSINAPLRMTDAPASENIEGERKTVTALFADIKGSTELMEDLDPEEARAIIDPALKLMIDAVHRYDGYVVQSTGDGIFALFGAPLAHEDHPQRALYAALRLQEEMRRYSAKLREAGNLPVEARVGVNTGEVVVRTIATGDAKTEYTPIGHTANLASRMQALAPTGSIVVSENTRRLVEGYFVLKPLGPTRVKGLSEPVNVYEVTGLGPLRTRLQRSAGRGLTKFVGRDREMEALKHAAELARQGHGQIAAVMADPGVGKSRLFFEFKAISQSGWMVLETFSVSHGKASAFLPVIDLLHNYFRIAPDDSDRARREKINGKVLTLDRTLEDALPHLIGLLGLIGDSDPLAQIDPQVRRQRTTDAVKRLLLRESLNQPLMLIFEDLHWIDSETRDFLDHLAGAISGAPVLLLVNYRPEYRHEWGNRTHYTQLRLDPLAAAIAAEMLSALLGPSPIPLTGQGEGKRGEEPRAGEGFDLAALKRLIIERTEGNPFFMEEMVLALFADGTLIRNGAVKLTRALSQLKIPPTVQAILAARIDRLPANEKALLQTLAAIGEECALNLIERVARLPSGDLHPLLANLCMAEFIYEQPAAAGPAWSFKHAITQEVAYGSMLLERRRQLHERAAAAIEELFAATLGDHLDELARHYSRGGNLPKAVHYLKLAGEQAGRRSAYDEALGSLTKAIGLLGGMPESGDRDLLELELRVVLGPFYAAVRGFATSEMEPHVGRMRELCDRLGESPAIINALFTLWSLNLARARLHDAMPLARRLIKLAASLAAPFAAGSAHAAVGVTSMWLGEFRAAREHLEWTSAIFEPDLPRYLPMPNAPVIPTLCQLAWTLWLLGYPDQANRSIARALALADQLKRPFNSAFALQYAIPLHDFQRDYRSIELKIDALIEISREYGFTSWIDSAHLSRGRAMVFRGDHAGGIAVMLEALTGLREHGSELVRTFSLPLLADSFLRSLEIDRGLEFITEAFASMNRTGARIQEAEFHRLRGELLLARDVSMAAEAEQSFGRAIEIARRQEAKSWELRATMSLARLLRDSNRRNEARTMLSSIYNWFTEGFDTSDLIDAKTLLGELSG